MDVFAELSEYLRRPYYLPGLSSLQSTHEAIKAQLYVLGNKLGYAVILEAVVQGSPRDGRIDCLFLHRIQHNIICAIEIDGEARDKSLVKLLSLGESVEKIIISSGSVDSWESLREKAGNDYGFAGVHFFRLKTRGEA